MALTCSDEHIHFSDPCLEVTAEDDPVASDTETRISPSLGESKHSQREKEKSADNLG